MRYALQLHWFGNWHNVTFFEDTESIRKYLNGQTVSYRVIDLETKEEISIDSIINDFDWMREGF